MEPLFAFLIRSSAGIILFYTAYWIFLRNETFHHANRWYFVGALSLSVLLPLFPLRYNVPVETGDTIFIFQAMNSTLNNTLNIIHPDNSANPDASAGIGLTGILAAIWITGAFLVLTRLVIQTGGLIRLLICSKITSSQGIRIAENRKYNAVFSFFNIVFINPEFINKTDLPKIIAHEKVHIHECHWCDLIIIELLTVIFWFNPFIWFFERSIRQNHEYLADKGVLSMGYSEDQYRTLLVSQLMGIQLIGLTNSLNFALNKNRFKMMTKKRTPGLRSLKLLVSLPVLVTILFAFAEPNYIVRDSAGNISGDHFSESQELVSLAGEVVDEHGNPVHGVSVVIKGTTTGTITGPEGKFELEFPLVNDLVLSYVGKETILDDLSDIKSTRPVQGKYQRRYVIREGVFNIDREVHFLAPPPPPPPAARERSDRPVQPPPPPPPVRDRTERTEIPPVEADEVYEEVFIIVEEMPAYPGSFYALGQYVKGMEEKLSREQSLKGEVLVGFTVDENGKVTNIRVLETDNDAVAGSAIDIVSGMADWRPGKQRGKPVPVNFTLPLEF